MISLIFPKVPQTSRPESLGFPSYPVPLNTPCRYHLRRHALRKLWHHHHLPRHLQLPWLWCQIWRCGKSFWVVVWNIFYLHPYLGKWSNLTHIFQMGWNHQLGLAWEENMRRARSDGNHVWNSHGPWEGNMFFWKRENTLDHPKHLWIGVVRGGGLICGQRITLMENGVRIWKRTLEVGSLSNILWIYLHLSIS